MMDPPVLLRWRLAHARALACCLAAMAGLAAHAASVQVDLLDAAGKPLADAIVFLESADARRLTKPLPGVEMAQEKRQFVPSVMVVPVGSEVLFPNRDTVRHHVYSFSPTKKFELKLYTGTPSKPVLFDQAGVVLLGCNIHDRMVGWILVVDTPYFAKSLADTGRAQLDNVAPGAYKLRAWHARLPVGEPALEQALTVPATGNATATVRMAGLQP